MKIMLSRKQWESMGRQAGWDTDVIDTPEFDFSVHAPQFDAKVMNIFVGIFPAIREIFDRKVNVEKKERPEALKEVFENVVKAKQSLLRQYYWLFNKIEENRNIPISQLISSHKIEMVKRSMMSNEQLKVFVAVMESIKGKGKYTYAPEGRIYNSHLDISFYDSPQGEAYIQVYFDDRHNMMAIEKYYDNESMNNEYAETKYVPLDLENPQSSIANVNMILDGWLGNAKGTKPEPMCDMCGSSSHHAEECPYFTGGYSTHPVTSHRIKKITLISSTDPLQPTDGVQTSEAVNPERKKAKLHCKKCGGPLKKVMQKNPAGLEEAVWKCDCGCNEEPVK